MMRDAALQADGPKVLQKKRKNTAAGGARARRRRTIVVGTVLGALAVAFAVGMPRGFSMTLTPPEVQYVEVTVARGETLWDIAATYKDGRTDTRDMVYKIRTANELVDATVYPGQVLKIPAGVR